MMKNFSGMASRLGMVFAICATLLFIGAATTGCVSPQAKERVLAPAVELAWPGVRDDLQRGISDGLEDGEIDEETAAGLSDQVFDIGVALAEDDFEALGLAPWEALEVWADRGVQDRVDDGEIGPGVAVSRIERIDQFGRGLDRLRE